MLFILNRSFQVIDNLSITGDMSKVTPYFEDFHIEDLTSGAETFSFEMQADLPQASSAIVGNYIAFRDEKDFKLFTIFDTDENHSQENVRIVYCEMASIELLNNEIRPTKYINTDVYSFLDSILPNTDWQLGSKDLSLTSVKDIDITEYTSVYEVIQEYIIKDFGAEIRYRVEIESNEIVGKYIDVFSKRGKISNVLFSYTSNMTNVSRKTNIGNLVTALIGVGKNNITFRELETADKPAGQDFITSEEAYKRWSKNGKHIVGTQKFETDSPYELLNLTIKALQERISPQVKYELKVELLGSKVAVGDTVRVVDHEFNPPLYLEARVNQLKTCKTDSTKDEVILSNFKEINSNITNEMRKISNELIGYVDGQFPVGSNEIQDGAVTGNKISDVYTQTITTDLLRASEVQATSLVANYAEIANAKIENLETKSADIEKLVADTAIITEAEIDNLKAKDATIENLIADKANIGDLTATNAEIINLKAKDAVLESTITTNLTATNAEITNLKADVADIDTLLAGNLTAGNIQAGSITAGSGIIANGAIGSAQISSLDAGKVNAGTVDTSKVTIAGANGNLKITGNRLQVFTGIGTGQKERVSVGDVNADGTVYGLRVRGADGTTVLLDENGVKKEGITNGSITNEKIDGNANIDGAKLNINSVVTKINAGTTSIASTKIDVNGTNLSVKMGNVDTALTDQADTIAQQSSEISANTSSINLKVDSQTYQTDKTNMTTTLNKATSDISVLNGQIALKVEQTNIDTAKTELESSIETKVAIAKAEVLVDVTEINDALSDLSDTMNTTFKDGIVNDAESKIIGDRITQLDKEKADIDKQYTTVYANVDLAGTAKTNLSTAKTDYDAKHTDLKNYITTSITDKVITTTEKTDISTKMTAYTTSLSTFGEKLQQALDSISTKKKTDAISTSNTNTSTVVNSAKAEIKVTTDAITQNVTNLTTTVDTKADGSTVNTLTSRVGSLETSVDGINATVSSLETTTNTLGTDINILEGEVNTVKSNVATLDINLDSITQRVSSTETTTTTLTTNLNNTTNTANNALTNANNANTLAGTKAKVFTDMPATPYAIGDLWTQGTSGDVMKCKVARASGSYVVGDWEKASKYTDDTTANAAKSTADTATNSIVTTNSKVSAIETGLSGITSRVGNVETKQNTTDGKVTSLETRVTTAESKITDTAITNTVKKDFYTKGETETQITSKGYQTNSQVQQLVDKLEIKFEESGGYNRVKNGQFKYSYNSWVDWGVPFSGQSVSIGSHDNGVNYVRLVTKQNNQGIQQLIGGLEIGKKYTFSASCEPNTEVVGTIQVYNKGDFVNSNIVGDGTKKRLTVTFEAKHTDCIIYLGVGTWSQNKFGTLRFWDVQFEDGEIATPIAPNPNEVYDGITTIDKDGIKITNSNSNTYTQIDSSSFSVNNNSGGIIAEFSRNSFIPNLESSTIIAERIIANNVASVSPTSSSDRFIYVDGATGNDLNTGENGSRLKTVQKAIDILDDVINTNTTIYVYNSVPGFELKGKTGCGVISFSFQDSCIVNGMVTIAGVTNSLWLANDSRTKKAVFKRGLKIDDCVAIELYCLTFRGLNQHTCNIYAKNVRALNVGNCDLGGLSETLSCAIKALSTSIWVHDCIGSNIADVVGLYAFTQLYFSRRGTITCPEYKNGLYVQYDGGERNQIFQGCTFIKAPSSGWNPTYTPSAKTQQWNFNKIWSEENLNKWGTKNELIQGRYDGWSTGRWTGYMQMTDGCSGIRSVITGGTNLSGRIYVQRRNTSGNSTGSTLYLYASDGTQYTATIDRGKGVWINLGSTMISKIMNGSVNYFYLKADANNASTYFKCESNAKIEITYTK